jgi:hypothetical protein
MVTQLLPAAHDARNDGLVGWKSSAQNTRSPTRNSTECALRTLEGAQGALASVDAQIAAGPGADGRRPPMLAGCLVASDSRRICRT